ncbi:Golgi-associated plant pathogenesis-related protein 1-like [Amblyomma americanum]
MRFRSVIPIAVLVLTLLIAVEARRKIKPKEYKGKFTPFMKRFQRQVLERHNVLRPKHGVPKLKLNERLNRFAQARANELAERMKNEKGKQLWHRDNYPYGENLYWSPKGHRFRGKKVVDVWYAEIKKHNFTRENPPGDVLHFTQVAWKKTRRLGVGIAKAKDGSYYVSALYDPKGNYRTEFLENVPRPIREASSSVSC